MFRIVKVMTLILPTIAYGTVITGCAEDLKPTDNGPPPGETNTSIVTTDNPDGTFTTLVDASENETWQYFDFESGQGVETDSPETSSDWDTAFQRFNIKSNSGINGAGEAAVAVMPGTDFDTLEAAPLGGYLQDVEDGDDEDEDPDLAFGYDGGWYNYNPANHTLSPKDVVYVVRSVEGNYFKLQILNYYDEAGSSGYPSFRWGPIDPPQSDDVIEVVSQDAEAWVYLSVASQGVVSITDPETSMEWDVAINRTRFQTNGGLSGAGWGGAQLASAPNYESLSAAPTTGFYADSMIPLPGPPGSGEFAGNPVLNDWYDYDPATHSVSAKDTVFLLRTADGDYGKLQILSYENGTYRLRLAPVERATSVETLVIELTEEPSWVYFNLRMGEMVEVENATTSADWDIGFNRTRIRTNGGTSGPGSNGALDTSASSLDDVTTAPADGYQADSMIPLPGPPGSGEFSGNAVLNGWFDYDPSTHTVTPKETVFVVKTADEGFVKLRITDFHDEAMTLDWAFSGPGRSSWASE